MTTKFPLKMSERAFVCQLTLLIIDTYSNILIESPINTNEMYSSVNEKRIYVIDITFGINESIFSGNEQQKVYFFVRKEKEDYILQLKVNRLQIIVVAKKVSTGCNCSSVGCLICVQYHNWLWLH